MEDFLSSVFGSKERIPSYLSEYLADECGVMDVDDFEALWQCNDEWRALGKPFLPVHKAKIALPFQRRREVGTYRLSSSILTTSYRDIQNDIRYIEAHYKAITM